MLERPSHYKAIYISPCSCKRDEIYMVGFIEFRRFRKRARESVIETMVIVRIELQPRPNEFDLIFWSFDSERLSADDYKSKAR